MFVAHEPSCPPVPHYSGAIDCRPEKLIAQITPRSNVATPCRSTCELARNGCSSGTRCSTTHCRTCRPGVAYTPLCRADEQSLHLAVSTSKGICLPRQNGGTYHQMCGSPPSGPPAPHDCAPGHIQPCHRGHINSLSHNQARRTYLEGKFIR